jgi:peptide/nickel transport system permease protein
MSDTVAAALFRAALASGKVRIGAAIVLGLVAIALFARWLAPHDPQAQDLLNTLQPPMWDANGSATFPLGTDSLGRDILSRAIYGSQVALTVAISAASGALVLGGLLALIAGYFGGKVDWLITHAVDLWMSFPPVVLSLLLMVGLGIGLRNVILSIVLVDWTRFCRVARAEILVVRRRDYVTAARLIGFGHLRTIVYEVFPAVLPLLITLFSLEMGIAVVVEAILSFVGLSVGSDVTAWGVMIADGRGYVNQAPWALITPIIAIIVAVLGFNLLGDGLRQALDLRLRSERV